MTNSQNSLWLLDPHIHFLNHGSFGATPIPVLDYQSQLRQQLEREPLRFFGQELEPLLDFAREKLAEFIGGDPHNLVFVPNATAGVNTVLRNLSFQLGDEILITNHTYNACRNSLDLITKVTSAQIRLVNIPFPLASSQQITEAILTNISPKTKLVFLDHVTSQTALIFPLETLIKTLSDLEIETLIDGAHAPGFIPLNLQKLGATYYTGNCHKWLSAPKGSAFLYVHPEKQAQIRPLIISHGANSPRTDRSRFHLEFDWTGTHDPTPYLCIPKAIQIMESLLPGGWTSLWQRNRNLTLEARQILCNILKIDPPCPDDLIGSMASIPLGKIFYSGEDLYKKIIEEFNIEVPIFPWQSGEFLIRISVQFYNTIEQYQYLAEILAKL